MSRTLYAQHEDSLMSEYPKAKYIPIFDKGSFTRDANEVNPPQTRVKEISEIKERIARFEHV